MFSSWCVQELSGHNHCHCRLAPGRPGHGPTHQSKLRDIVNICLHVRPDSDLFDSFHIKHNQKDFSKWWYIHQGPLEKQAQGFKGLNKGYQNGFSNLSYMFHRKKIRYTFLWVNFIHLIFYYFSFDFGDCHSLICNEQYKKLIKRVIILEFLELEQVWY